MRQHVKQHNERRLCLEPLEERRLLSTNWYEYAVIGDSAIDGNALEMWDWINQMREDPEGMLYKIFDDPDTLTAKDPAVNDAIKNWVIGNKTDSEKQECIDAFLDQWYLLESVSPLALNGIASKVAETHTKLMDSAKEATHQVAGEAELQNRLEEAQFDSVCQPSENIVYGGKKTGTLYNKYYRSACSFLFAAMAIDWGRTALGHRANIMDPNKTEVGISVCSTSNLGYYATTVDFVSSSQGASSDGGYLFGLIYNDKTGNGLFTADAGEVLNAKNGYSVTIRRLSDGESVVINSTANGLAQDGAYQIYLENGSYEVSIAGGSFKTGYSQKVEISGGKNVKADFLLQNINVTQPILDLNADEEGTGTEASFLEQAVTGTKLSAGVFTLSSGGTRLTKMKISFGETGRPDGANESVNVTLPESSTFRVSYNTENGDLNISGSGTEEDYRQVISSLAYLNITEGYANLADRTIEISVYNGLYWSDTATVSLSIVPTLLPTLTISDATVWEGDSDQNGTKTLIFNAQLDAPARLDVTFHYEIQDQTAIVGTNYSAADAAGSVTIAQGETSAQIFVTVYGNYDAQEDLTLLLAVVGKPENAIFEENQTAVGLIRDDDTPVFQYKGISSWNADTTGSFERGQRRYLYTCTTEANGLVQWSATGPNMTLTVYVGWNKSACANPVAVSKWKDGRMQVEWYAEEGTTYYIKLEGSQYYRNPALVFLAISDDKTVLADPLLNEKGHLTAGFKNGTLTLGEGEKQWTIPSHIVSTVTLSSSRSDAVFDFLLDDTVTAALDPSNNRLTLGDFSLVLAGFSGYLFTGSDAGEEVLINGSDGNDVLNYSRGEGTLTLYADDPEKKSVYRFQNITQLNFDGGNGKDTAQLYDTSSNDTASYTGKQIHLAGGGYSLALKNFNNVTLETCNGGNNTLYVTPDTDDTVTALIGTIQITGTCSFEAKGLTSIQVDAQQTEKPVSVICVSDEKVHYKAELGTLSAANSKTTANLNIQYAQELILLGVEKDSPQVAVTIPDDCTKTEDANSINYKKGAYALKLKLKNKTDDLVTSSSVSLLTQENETSALLPIDEAILAVVSVAEPVRAPMLEQVTDTAILELIAVSDETTEETANSQESETLMPVLMPETVTSTSNSLLSKKKRLGFLCLP